MMPDLGKYTFVVLASYGSTIALVGALILISVRSWRKAKADLDQIEQRTDPK